MLVAKILSSDEKISKDIETLATHISYGEK